MDFVKKSIEIIKENQHAEGAYIASPNFTNYKYSWLRDGAFIANAMDQIGEHESARGFYHWVNNTIVRNQVKLQSLYVKQQSGQNLEAQDFLACRYTLEGLDTNDDWPNFQLDGYGTWLWGLSEHIKLTNNYQLLDEFKESIEGTIAYLRKFWRLANSDCWEENADKIHPSTLACIHGGLTAINQFLKREEIDITTVAVQEYLISEAIYQNRFVKYIGSTNVDASLLWLTVPFKVFAPDDPYVLNTVKVIEEQLLHEGGVHRFPEDTYYGGGEWLLLSSWLGWYYVEVGRYSDARKQLAWVEKQADEEGLMPEQVLHHVNDPVYIEKWEAQWGVVAKPLIWSHAMYLVLHAQLKKLAN